jgi:membrane protein required for colicin V production
MDWVDLIVLAVLAGSIFLGMVQGFFRTVCSLLGLILGVVLASWNYVDLAMVFKRVVKIDAAADAIAFLLIAALVMILANVVGVLLKKFSHWMGLGCMDTVGGAIAGLLQGALLVTVCLLVTVAFFPQTEWLTEAKFPQLFFRACHLDARMSPDELSGRVKQGLRILKHEMPRWMHEKNGGS